MRTRRVSARAAWCISSSPAEIRKSRTGSNEGARPGFLLLRWQGLPGPLPVGEAPTAQVVPLASVRGALPSATPTISPRVRGKEFAARAKALGRRLRISSNQAVETAGYLRQLAGEVGTQKVMAIYRGTPLPAALEPCS